MNKNKQNMQEKWLKKFGGEYVYNKHCKYLCVIDDKYRCKIKMDMMFCGNNCAYATNNSLSTKVYKKERKKRI